MSPDQFDTQAFFMSDREALGPTNPNFGRDLERFARRAETAEKSQGGIMALEALVIFGQAGRNIDEACWNRFAGEVAAQVRKGEDENAARLLVPVSAKATVETLTPTAECARIVQEDVGIDSEAIAHSRCAAIVAALFRALSRHFASDAAIDEGETCGEQPAEDELADGEPASGISR